MSGPVAEGKAAILEKSRAVIGWLRKRVEIVVPLLALPVFFSMLGSGGKTLPTSVVELVGGAALLYAGLVIWSPMALPLKELRAMSWKRVGWAARIVVPSVLIAALITIGLSVLRGLSGSTGSGSLVWFSLYLLLAAFLGSVGLAAEGSLPVDLFPEFRQRKLRRIVYAVVAAFFLVLLSFLWEELFSSLIADPIGLALGETQATAQETASGFEGRGPLDLLVNMLVGAGFFEELLFRVGIMTTVWWATRRWGWGLLVSALLFGLYHISPFSGQSAINLQTAPVIAVLSSFGMGLANGFIYRHRGFLAAVLAHGMGNWLVLITMSGAGGM